jgi:hypothetical protein
VSRAPAAHSSAAAAAARRSFDQALKEWPDTTATLETTASMTGSMRSFFANGKADFPGLTLKGAMLASCELTLTVTGPQLFGSGVDSMSVTANVTIQACELGETFDAAVLACTCATGYGLVVETGACVRCGADQVVPLDTIVQSCATCPPLSAPDGLNDCRCNAGYFGSIFGVTGVCTQVRARRPPRCTCAPPLALFVRQACGRVHADAHRHAATDDSAR